MKKIAAKIKRGTKGFALVSILTFGAVSLAVLFAFFPQIISSLRSENGHRALGELRTAASTGVDYAIQQLNDNAENNPGSVSPIDLVTSTVPAKYLPNFSAGTVKIRIKQIGAGDFANYSTIYSPTLDASPLIKTNNWRVVESTATRGGISRSIRVFLEPRYDKPSSETSTPPAGTSSYFKSAFLANSDLDFSPTVAPLSVGSPYSTSSNPAYQLTLQGNVTANLGTSLTLDGNFQIPAGSQPAIGSPSRINGQVNSDQSFDLAQLDLKGFTTAGALATVIGNSMTPPGQQIVNNSVVQPLVPAPAPSSGTTAPLPTVTSMNTLESGSYTTTSADFSATGNSAKIDSPVKIYVQDGVSGVNAATLNASSISNISTEASNGTGAAQNFQIWYSGNRPISINLGEGGTFKGLIYAPNAPITIQGHGTFKGALVGFNVKMNTDGNTSILIDTSLQDSSNSQTKSAGLTYAMNTGGTELQDHGYKAVTWQEIKGALVP